MTFLCVSLGVCYECVCSLSPVTCLPLSCVQRGAVQNTLLTRQSALYCAHALLLSVDQGFFITRLMASVLDDHVPRIILPRTATLETGDP